MEHKIKVKFGTLSIGMKENDMYPYYGLFYYPKREKWSAYFYAKNLHDLVSFCNKTIERDLKAWNEYQDKQAKVLAD